MADIDLTSPINACENAIDHFAKIIDEHHEEAGKASRKADEHNRRANEAVVQQCQWVAAKQALIKFRDELA